METQVIIKSIKAKTGLKFPYSDKPYDKYVFSYRVNFRIVGDWGGHSYDGVLHLQNENYDFETIKKLIKIQILNDLSFLKYEEQTSNPQRSQTDNQES